MNRALAAVVLQTFQDPPPAQLCERLGAFSSRQWERSLNWLDNKGIALYFLDRLKQLRWECRLPASLIKSLEQRLDANRIRTDDLLAEFERINRAFLKAGVLPLNIKGVALVPDSCPDLTLRHQLDLDLMIREADIEVCRPILHKLGYSRAKLVRQTWEFSAGPPDIPGIKDMYAVKLQRQAEIHLEPMDSPLFVRHSWAKVGAFAFPVLSASDAFLFQAEHLWQHLRSEWLRLNWLLEFRNNVLYHSGDKTFWSEVRLTAEGNIQARTAIGVALALISDILGAAIPEELSSWAGESMDGRLRLWLKRYGRDAVLADLPGSKLYLLLPSIGISPVGAGPGVFQRLCPLYSLPRLFSEQALTQDGTVARYRRWRMQMKFILFRLRFHIVEGFRYSLELSRWRKILESAQP